MIFPPLDVQVLEYLQSVRASKGVRSHASTTEALVEESRILFVGTMDFLRSSFPNPTICQLAKVIGQISTEGIVSFDYDARIKTLTLAAQNGRCPYAQVLVPRGWPAMISQDPLSQVGAMLIIGSYLTDYVNDRLFGDRSVAQKRAHAYEAEFFLTIRKVDPSWSFRNYQTGLVRDFPQGVNTPKVKDVLYPVYSLILA